MHLLARVGSLAILVGLLSSCSVAPIAEVDPPGQSAVAIVDAAVAQPCADHAAAPSDDAPVAVWLRTALASTLASRSSARLDWFAHQLDLAQVQLSRDDDLLACLQSVTNRALDARDGWRYLDADDTPAWTLVDTQGRLPVNPLEFAVAEQNFYLIDGGTIYRGELPTTATARGVITVTAVLTSAAAVDGISIQEPIALDVIPGTQDLIVIDRANDLYRFAALPGEWRREANKPVSAEGFTPQYVDLAIDETGIQYLDVAGNRIVRRTWDGAEWNVMNSGLTWMARSLGHGVAMAAGASVTYALLQNGEVMASSGGGVRTFAVPSGITDTHLVAFKNAPFVPVALAVDDVGGALYVADEGKRRIVALSIADGSVLEQIAAPAITEFGHLQGVQVGDGALWVMAGGRLFRTALAGGEGAVQVIMPTFKQMPAWVAEEPAPGVLTQALPQAVNSLAALEAMAFTMPIAGASLPERLSLYPGARRAYRYGVHHGIDFFPVDSKAAIEIGTPVRAVQDGTVVRADSDYAEMSIAEVDALLEKARQQHGLSDVDLDKLGGRQVRINHGNGVWSIYSHLDSVAEGTEVGTQVKAGQVIGTVGLSGTPDGVRGASDGAHLHFEVWLGSWPRYYLGQWLTLEATQRVYQQLFSAKEVVDLGAEGVDLEVTAPGQILQTGRASEGARPSDHYWLGSPFAPTDDQTPSDYYLFGDTADGALRPHRGVDTQQPVGVPLLAVADGTVLFAGADDPELLAPFPNYYGRAVVIQLDRQVMAATGPQKVFVLYGHMDRVDVTRGQRVVHGQQVGAVGETGIAMGPHLHLEVRVGENRYGDAVNPLLWMRPDPGSGNLALRIVTTDGRAWDAAVARVHPVLGSASLPAAQYKTYRTADGIGSDPVWGENLVIPFLRAGTYTVSIEVGDARIERLVTVQAGRTAFLEVKVSE